MSVWKMTWPTPVWPVLGSVADTVSSKGWAERILNVSVAVTAAGVTAAPSFAEASSLPAARTKRAATARAKRARTTRALLARKETTDGDIRWGYLFVIMF